MAGIAQKIIADPDSFSIDMLTQGVQDGSVPAYIGVPLIQEKMQAQKEQEALMGGTQQEGEPPIAHQILGEAQQTNGVEALPTGLPAEGFAPGGIITFADGGYADDEEDDGEEDSSSMSEDEQRLFNALRSRLASSGEYEEMSGIGALPLGAAKTAVRETKHEVSSKVGDEPKKTKSEGVKQLYKEDTPTGGISQLTKEGTPAGDLIDKIMQKESGGRRYDKNGNLLEGPQTKYGTAKGEMQVMDATARDPGYGIRPARPGDPDDLARVGREYFGKMMDKYGNPKIAAIAYNWGPGNTDKWLAAGADMSKLPKETYNYSRNMAKGGSVKHYVTGDLVGMTKEEFDKMTPEEQARAIETENDRRALKGAGIASLRLPAAAADIVGGPVNYLSQSAEKGLNALGVARAGRALGIYDPDTTSVTLPRIGSGSGTPFMDKIRAAQQNVAPLTPEQAAAMTSRKVKPVITEADKAATTAETEKLKRLAATPNAPAVPRPAVEEETTANAVAAAAGAAPERSDYLKQYAELLKSQQEQNVKNKETDKYMALLQAGLGMMGGTSRYAGANIGQGASQGVAAMMAARKQQSADERALMSGNLGLARADLYEKMHSEDIARRKEAGIKGEEAKYMSQIVSLQNAAYKNAVTLIGQDKLGAMEPTAAEARVQEVANKMLSNSKAYRDLHKKAKLGDPFEGMDSGGGSGTIERVWSDIGKKK